MTEPVPFEPHRFRTAAAHYLAGRSPYPAALIRRVVELVPLGPGDRVLDLGCGPGQLALGFAPHVAGAVGVDPEPEMLCVARAAAEGVPNLRFMEGSSYDLGPALGRFRLAAMGRSFHWMDRPDTLRRLDAMIEAGGAVGLFGDRHPDLPENAWRPAWRALRDRYAGEEARPRWQGPGWVPHESVLLDSAFARLERIAVIERRRLTLAALAERSLSMSSTSRAGIGDRADALAREIPRALAEFATDGALTEVVESYALLAWRP